MSMEPARLADFEAELYTVQQALAGAAEELGMPLGELVRAQAKHAMPPLRAALVLAVGYDPQSDDARRRQRIFLAAALEMLYIALHVHRLLATAATLEGQANDLDKAFIGSTILAGDYCFSRAASMAAQTDSPRVVTLFAQALQTVSEGHLRALFGAQGAAFDENRALLLAGAEAALELAGLSAPGRPAYRKVALGLAETLAESPLDTRRLVQQLPEIAGDRQARWQALLQWLMGERANGWTVARSPL